MSLQLNKELARLQRLLLEQGARIEASVLHAVAALERRDVALARQVIDDDDTVDRCEVDIEEECLKILALHRPVAFDLRCVVAMLKINADLERMADLAAGIAKRAIQVAALPGPEELPFALPAMASKVTDMVRLCLDAMVQLDADLARRVCATDPEIDAHHRQNYARMRQALAEQPQYAACLARLLPVSRNLERIADHATNIAEDILYIMEGEIVRHRTPLDEPAGRPQ